MGNDKMEAMAEAKLLDYNPDKSCFIIIGKVKARLEVQKQLQICPLMLCGSDMKEEKHAKYLGDWLICHGLAYSVNVTVKKRKGLVTLSIYEIRAVIAGRTYLLTLCRSWKIHNCSFIDVCWQLDLAAPYPLYIS